VNLVLPSVEEIIVGFKYYPRLRKAKEMTEKLITDLYSTLPEYEGKKDELEMTLHYPSRVLKFLGMQSFSIYDANVNEGANPPISDTAMAALQNIAYEPATMLDDLHDEVCVRYFAEREGWTREDVLKLITNPEKLYELVKVQVPFIDSKTKEKLVPLHLFRASYNLMKFYEEEMKKINEKALNIYLTERNNVWPYQATDVAISAWVRKGDIESVIKTIGDKEEKYKLGLLDLLNKLGIIGEASAAIVNEVTSVGNKKHSSEKTTPALRSFYGPITKFSQFGIDDVDRIREDLEAKTGNILILSMLPYYQTISESSFSNFIKERPHIISEIAIPLINQIYEGLKQLKDLDFAAYKDSQLATDLVMKKVKKNVENFAKSFHVEPDLEWWEISEELKSQL
jgi:hypothetical protein